MSTRIPSVTDWPDRLVPAARNVAGTPVLPLKRNRPRISLRRRRLHDHLGHQSKIAGVVGVGDPLDRAAQNALGPEQLRQLPQRSLIQCVHRFGLSRPARGTPGVARLLLGQAMQRSETEHQVDGVDADDAPVREKISQDAERQAVPRDR